MSLWIDAAQHLATQDRNVRPRLDSDAFWGDTVINLASRFAPRMRSATVTDQADREFTRGSRNRVLGKRSSAAQRAVQRAAYNQCVYTYQFKGIGRPYQYGFYNIEKYTFTDAPSTYTALPLYAFDLTSINNNINNARVGHCPLLRAYRNQTSLRIEWHPCQSQNASGLVVPTAALSKSTEEVAPNSTAWSQWQLIATNGVIAAAGNDGYTNQYIDTVDIYMNMFAARTVPTRWCVDVCSFDDNLAPYCANNTTYVSTVTSPEDALWHTSYWTGEMMTYVNHPLNTQRGTRGNPTLVSGSSMRLNSPFGAKGYKSYLRKPVVVIQQPADTTISEPSTATASRCHTEKITLKMRKGFNMMPRSKTAANVLNTLQGMDADGATLLGDPAGVGITIGDDIQTTPNQSSRVFIIIKGTDYDDKAWSNTVYSPCRQSTAAAGVGGAGFQDAWATKLNDKVGEIATHVDFSKSGSFDLNVIKRVIRAAP